MSENKITLKSLYLSGYKSYSSKKPQSIEFGKTNVIIGANGAGKSNLVSFFDFLSYIMTGGLQEYVSYNTPQYLLYYGPKVTESITARIVIANENKENNYEFKLIYTLNNRLIFAGEKLAYLNKNNPSNLPSIIDYGAGHQESVFSDKKSEDLTKRVFGTILSRGLRVYHFNDTSQSAKVRIGGYVEDCKYLRDDAGNLAAFLYRLKTTEKYLPYYNRILDFIHAIFPQLSDFVLEPSYIINNNIRLNWKTNNSDELFGPHQLSDGSIRFISLATALLQPLELSPGVLILDEPEIGLHPHAIALLANMIRLANKDRQIILATQSPGLLDTFQIDDVIIAEYDSFENTSLLRRDLSEKDYRDWLDRYTLSQLWEKNIIGGLPS
jgi:predicted ATPase